MTGPDSAIETDLTPRSPRRVLAPSRTTAAGQGASKGLAVGPARDQA